MKDELDILGRFDSYEEIPAAVRAWITIKAKQQGKNPNMVHAGYKAAFARINGTKKAPKTCNCRVCPIRVQLDTVRKILNKAK